LVTKCYILILFTFFKIYMQNPTSAKSKKSSDVCETHNREKNDPDFVISEFSLCFVAIAAFPPSLSHPAPLTPPPKDVGGNEGAVRDGIHS
jgi:hypothetical protein